VDTKPRNAELEPIISNIDSPLQSGKTSKISLDIANIAPGKAYYIIVDTSTPIGDLKKSRYFLGTLDPDDFSSLTIELKVYSNVTQGEYPLNLTIKYKNEDYEEEVQSKAVMLKVIEARTETISVFSLSVIAFAIILVLVLVIIIKAPIRAIIRPGR